MLAHAPRVRVHPDTCSAPVPLAFHHHRAARAGSIIREHQTLHSISKLLYNYCSLHQRCGILVRLAAGPTAAQPGGKDVVGAYGLPGVLRPEDFESLIQNVSERSLQLLRETASAAGEHAPFDCCIG